MNEQKMFAIAEVMPGQLNALVKNIMRQTGEDDPNEAVRLVNSGEWVMTKPTCAWREQDGVIYLALTSTGKSGAEWIPYLESRKFRLSKYSKDVLLSLDFKPTPAGTVHRVAILKGELFSDEKRITRLIRADATKRKLNTPHPEIGPLFRDAFSDQDIERMGLIWVVMMHDPIKDSGGDPYLLNANRNDDGRWLSAAGGYPGFGWYREHGFAFSVPQVQSSTSVA